ncbi:MAG: exopolysaccharide biosynthesis protein [Brucellaceae bacterium]|nr:exopolysaccharide biosynthesis protein [Brucellaceae bacterium]
MPDGKIHFHRRSGEMPPPRAFSTVLRELASQATHDVSIETVQKALADRSFAALIMFFSAINLLPLPIGSSVILGLPLIIISAQMLMGYPAPWLPRFIASRSISAETFRKMETRLTPRVEKLEKYIRPRRWPFDRRTGEFVIGAVCLFLAVLLVIPLPLGNWPPAFALFFYGVALSERDGIILAVATAIGIGASVVFFGVLLSATVLAHAIAG